MLDPARHGFGFRNPVGAPPDGARSIRPVERLVYDRGLCFGMAFAALYNYVEVGEPLSELPPSPALLGELRRLHVVQFRPDVAMRVAFYWLRSRGGRGAPRSLRLPESGDPHILCFGPKMDRNFFRGMRGAHAVVPYRTEMRQEKKRVYVYDPNHPKSRDRFIAFGGDGGFRYGSFGTGAGHGITLVPLSALGVSRSGGSAGRPR